MLDNDSKLVGQVKKLRWKEEGGAGSGDALFEMIRVSDGWEIFSLLSIFYWKHTFLG